MNKTAFENTTSLHPDPIVAAWYSLVIVPGLLAYMPVLYTLVKKRTTFHQPFYTFVFSLAVGDLGIAAIYGQFYLVPTLLYGAPLGGQQVGSAVALFEAVMFMGVGGTSFAMSLSRLSAILFPMINKPLWNSRLFGHRATVFWVAGLWFHGLFVILTLILSGCRNAIADNLLSPTYHCETGLSQTVNEAVSTYVTVMITLVLLAINLITVFVLCLRSKKAPAGASREEARSRALEMRFLAQSLLVYLGLLLNNGFFQLVVTFKWFTYSISVLLGVCMFLNSAMSPVIFFSFNRPLRHAILEKTCGSKVGDM